MFTLRSPLIISYVWLLAPSLIFFFFSTKALTCPRVSETVIVKENRHLGYPSIARQIHLNAWKYILKPEFDEYVYGRLENWLAAVHL